MELSSMLCGSLARKGVWGRMDIHICIAEFLCCPPETITTLLIGYTPIQNKKLKKKRNGSENGDHLDYESEVNSKRLIMLLLKYFLKKV